MVFLLCLICIEELVCVVQLRVEFGVQLTLFPVTENAMDLFNQLSLDLVINQVRCQEMKGLHLPEE